MCSKITRLISVSFRACYLHNLSRVLTQCELKDIGSRIVSRYVEHPFGRSYQSEINLRIEDFFFLGYGTGNDLARRADSVSAG